MSLRTTGPKHNLVSRSCLGPPRPALIPDGQCVRDRMEIQFNTRVWHAMVTPRGQLALVPGSLAWTQHLSTWRRK